MDGRQLSEAIITNANRLKLLCEGIDERVASQAPKGRWSPKQIISHLSGPDGVGMVPVLRAFMEQDTPEITLEPGNPFMSERRNSSAFSDLVTEFSEASNNVASLVSGLSEEQLSRTAHIPALKEAPMGEYPTMGQFIEAIIQRHISYHTDHMRDILRELGVTGI
jgi:hypothetical protein